MKQEALAGGKGDMTPWELQGSGCYSLMGRPEGACMNETALARHYDRPGHKQSELRRRNTTSRQRKRAKLKACGLKSKECPGIIQYYPTNLIKHLLVTIHCAKW